VDSLKALDPNRPIREADMPATLTNVLCVPKTSSGADCGFCRQNSLFLHRSSPFFFLLAGNLAVETASNTTASATTHSPKISGFPVSAKSAHYRANAETRRDQRVPRDAWIVPEDCAINIACGSIIRRGKFDAAESRTSGSVQRLNRFDNRTSGGILWVASCRGGRHRGSAGRLHTGCLSSLRLAHPGSCCD